MVKFKAEFATEVLENLKTLVDETRKEKGCIQYDLIEESDNKGTFLVVETWENQQALDTHNTSKHFSDFVELVKEKQAEVTVYKGVKIY